MGMWRNRRRPTNQIWGSGVQHRPDDISIIGRKSLTDTQERILTDTGDIISPTDPDEFYSLNTAFHMVNYRNSLTNQRVDLALDDLCIGFEIINDDASASIGVAVGGNFASQPADAATLTPVAELKPKESRFFNIHTKQISIFTSGTAVEVRGTFLMP